METLPFDKIALCISGGGFRASGYGLGVLSYLNHLPVEGNTPLLHKVSYLSTTSGGSLLAALYMKSVTNEQDFAVFYEKALEFMDGEVLLKKALQKLSSKNEWTNTLKSRNVINAFAKVYDDYLEGQTFGEYWTNADKSHVKENCYNATEFNTGITFRFKTKPLVGNKYVQLDVEAAKTLKIADIIAASSCFPGGFEPLIFPNDFSADEEQLANFNKNLTITNPYGQKVEPPFAIMDGGITDNQGIESMMLADDKAKFSMVIIADVSNKFMSPWQPPVVSNKQNNATVNGWAKLLKLMPVVLGLSILMLFFEQTNPIGLLLLLPTFLGTWLSFKWESIFKRIKNIFDTDNNLNWDNIVSKYLNYFGSLSFTTLGYLLKVRLTSVTLLANDIFLKQVRRMRFTELYSDENWKNRRISTFIYELIALNNDNLKREIHGKIKKIIQEIEPNEVQRAIIIEDKFTDFCEKLNPSKAITDVAQVSSSMGTTLWFDKQDIKDKRLYQIIATGQFTTCFNLLEYVLLNELQNPTTFSFQEFKQNLESDWNKFRENPLWLVEQMNRKS